jgi:hypothetical protein
MTNMGMGYDGDTEDNPSIRGLISRLEVAMAYNDELTTKLAEQLAPILEPEYPDTDGAELKASGDTLQRSEVKESLERLVRRMELRNRNILKLQNRVHI